MMRVLLNREIFRDFNTDQSHGETGESHNETARLCDKKGAPKYSM